MAGSYSAAPRHGRVYRVCSKACRCSFFQRNAQDAVASACFNRTTMEFTGTGLCSTRARILKMNIRRDDYDRLAD